MSKVFVKSNVTHNVQRTRYDTRILFLGLTYGRTLNAGAMQHNTRVRGLLHTANEFRDLRPIIRLNRINY